MNAIPGAENLAPHSRRDYTPGGLDHKHNPALIISSNEAMERLSTLAVQRTRGLLTRDEWREEQQDVLRVTVPGALVDGFTYAIESIRENPRPTKTDGLLAVLSGV
jgi:hypothetical protein